MRYIALWRGIRRGGDAGTGWKEGSAVGDAVGSRLQDGYSCAAARECGTRHHEAGGGVRVDLGRVLLRAGG